MSAKNSLQNYSGFSPNQFVFSRNRDLPSVTPSALPTLEHQTTSDIVRENLNVMQAAHESYIKAEASERIKMALRKIVRRYVETEFAPGEKV